ncbi:phage tail terminator protein [Lactococcus lactis]|uniref:phage tail terminator protein n=1 Tax=Lactococcus lactis TaxID=1358 RepID=UPI0023A9FE33|nr:minor capsid protein [Lactococcus lactis]WEA55759.1 minor capsid protein [Lactococcus lactis]
MDFIERLKDSVNTIPNLPMKCILGYLKPAESLVLYPLPGSKVVSQTYDGEKDQELNYEFAMKSKDQEQIQKALWLIQTYLEELSELKSSDGSFDFWKIEIANKPYISNEDEENYYIFILDVQASITTYKERK